MRSLGDLVAHASWPYDCPARREARGILFMVVATWAGAILIPTLLAWAISRGGPHG